MLTIEDIIEIAKKNGAEVTKNSEGCGIGYTDDNGLFHSIDVKEVISKPVPIEITEGIKAISEYCNAISGCDECALKYKKQCLFDTSVGHWASLFDIGNCTVLDRKEKEAYWIKGKMWEEGIGNMTDFGNYFTCSRCHHTVKGNYKVCEDKYCRNCGSKMTNVGVILDDA
jgi:hypothetical protein